MFFNKKFVWRMFHHNFFLALVNIFFAIKIFMFVLSCSKEVTCDSEKNFNLVTNALIPQNLR